MLTQFKRFDAFKAFKSGRAWVFNKVAVTNNNKLIVTNNNKIIIMKGKK